MSRRSQGRPRALLFVFLITTLLLAACAAPPDRERPWTAADLRLLDPAGDASSASADILAVYTRTTAWEVQIRLDLLGLSPGDVPAMKVFLYDNHDYVTSPLVVDLPSGGRPRLVKPTGRQTLLRPRLVSDPALDTVTVSLSRFLIGGRYHLNVETYPPDASTPADRTGDIASDGTPAPGCAPLLLAFWNAFPAATPAQALRRWDGAHTGPNGGRHGLDHLLDSAGQFGIPVALLDLKTPASLAALDNLGGSGQVRSLLERGLLILPDAAYGEPADVALAFSRDAAAGFDLPASRFVYAASAELQPAYPAQFVPLADASHLVVAAGARLIPLPDEEAIQAADDGPSLEVRRLLAGTALSPDPSDLVVLGGSLPRSTWGNAAAAASTFAWLAAHPWIRPLNGEALLAFPAGSGLPVPARVVAQPGTFPSYDVHGDQVASFTLPDLLAKLQAAPHNPLTDLAWQTYFSLTAPTGNLQLQALRAQYYRDAASLLAASRWAEENIPPIDGCDAVGYDGQGGCDLSTQHFLAIFRDNGELNFLFYRDEQGIHQIIGPSSQFTVGLSDPSEWQVERGPAADPSVIRGAFAENPPMDKIQYSAGRATFAAPDGSLSISYQLTETGLEVTVQAAGPVSARIPLAVDPQAFFFGPSLYQGSLAPGSFTWGLANGLQVEVRTDARLRPEDFTASRAFRSQPEDPDQEYPPGHYLPFPLAVVSLSSTGSYHLQLIVK